MDEIKKKVMIFGVFDGLHDGHKFLISEASKMGENIVIVVTQDEVVFKMKNRFPVNTLMERIQAIEQAYPKAKVIVGDERMGAWTPLYEEKPDMVICGYDQEKLFNSLKDPAKKYRFKLTKIEKSFKGNKIHSTLLRKK